jgi:hypothetical protein
LYFNPCVREKKRECPENSKEREKKIIISPLLSDKLDSKHSNDILFAIIGIIYDMSSIFILFFKNGFV